MTEHDEMNQMIRRGASREEATPAPPETAPPDASRVDDETREAIAERVGLPGWGSRLRGDSVSEVADDARQLADAVARYLGRAAGGFDGGVRSNGASPAPTFESVLRAQIQERRMASRERAYDFDRINNNRRRNDA
jgi:hypothetical protein